MPLNYGYSDGALYFHCAKEGRKLQLIKNNNKVGFEIEYHSEVIGGNVSCDYTTRYRSIIGTGSVKILHADEEKRVGFDVIMKQHGKDDNTYIQRFLDKALVLKLEIKSLTAKQAGDWI